MLTLQPSTMPAGAMTQYLEADHLALGLLLEQAMASPFRIDLGAYEAFRAGLLRHIAMEEKVLLPAARAANGGQPIALAARLKRDHAALAMLLVPTPTPGILTTIAQILDAHLAVEEKRGGALATCEALLTDQSVALVERMRAVPHVRLAPHVDTPLVESHVRQLVVAALPWTAPRSQHQKTTAA